MNDPILLPFLQAVSETESDQILEQLISKHAEPTVKEIIKYKLRLSLSRSGSDTPDAEDVYSDVLVQVLEELQEFKSNKEKIIGNFRSYVAAITYHTCYEYIRERRPQRSRLKDRVRYLFTHHKSFAIWMGNDDEWLCGFAAWKDAETRTASVNTLHGLFETAGSSMNARVSEQENLGEITAEILNKAEGPIKLDDLVNLIADLFGIKEGLERNREENEEAEDQHEMIPDPRPGVDVELDRRVYMEQLWLEIQELRPLQRAALLLNLKDDKGRGMIVLLPLLGIASMDEIAVVLEMSPEQFAELWNDLPIDDSAIAQRLGITRQQVINLRKSARERLGRRMKPFE